MMLILIFDGQAALQSACTGISLCIETVIPALFPFLFLCSVITNALWGEPMPWLRHMARRLGIPSGAESLLIPAFLGGYPAGAQIIGTGFQEGRLSRQDAQRLLPLCNNAGPAFLFGMAALQFSQPGTAVSLWLIQILSVLFTGAVSGTDCSSTVSLSGKASSVSDALHKSVKAMAVICGWILLFQILNGFLERWVLWYFPVEVQVLVRGLLELSSGCCQLSVIGSPALRFLVCTVQLSFGGLCVAMQTASVIGSLSMTRYLRAKLFQTAAAAVLALLYLRWGWIIFAGAGAVIVFSPILRKNSCSFSAPSGV